MEDETERQRQGARALWESRAGAWDKWADKLAEMAARMNAPLLDAAQLAPGLRVLDLASGTGQPALTVAERVGDSGEVVATDVVAAMLDAVSRRADRDGRRNMRFEQADMEDLPFADASFDRVTCRFGLMFTPDAVAALQESRRVLKAGGVAAFMVWGPEDDVTMFRVINEVVRRELGESPHERHEFTPFRFGEPGTLGRMFRAAGYREVSEREVRFSPRIEVGAPFWQANLEMSLGTRFAELDEAQIADLNDRLTTAFAAYATDGRYELESHVRIGIGTV